MGLVKVEYDHIQFIAEGASTPLWGCTDMEQIVDAYQEVFKGELGRFLRQVVLDIDPVVTKVQAPI